MTRRRAFRWAAGAVVVVGLVVVAVLGRIVLGPGPMAFAGGRAVALAQYDVADPSGTPPELANATSLVRGEYLTRAADCAACHTTKGGTPFAGGRAFKLPFGTLYSPNITPDRATGIGSWSDADFLRAVHKGIAKDGTRLYPAFPYAAYTMLTDGDVVAIKSYLFSLRPVRAVPPANTLVFPFNQRSLMAIWSIMFNRDRRFEPVPQRSPQWNRGAYLVEAAGHCGECHSPRNLLQAVDNRRKFSGGVADGWNAYNITGDRLTGIGAWSDAEIAHYISTGHSAGRGTASGPMAEAVEASLRHLAPSDVAAVVDYLRTVPAIHVDRLPGVLAGPASSAPASFRGDVAGRRIFEGACASCHAWSGSGALLAEAQLTGARAVNDPSAANVAQMILSGTGHVGAGRPYMPAFAAAYSDKEIASVANYVVGRFGAKPSRITAAQVARLRSQQ